MLINNAGIDDDTPFLEIDRARWRAVIDTNLTGAFLMAQAVARQMAQAGGGVILHTASIDASGADGPYAAYNASKAGLLGLNRTMALELAAVRDPLQLRQPRVHPHGDDREGGRAGAHELPQRVVRPGADPAPGRTDEVAQAFLFLASDQASAITGTELRVDGGPDRELVHPRDAAGRVSRVREPAQGAGATAREPSSPERARARWA